MKGLDISEIQQSALVDDRDFEGRPYLRIAAKYRAQIKSNILLPGMRNTLPLRAGDMASEIRSTAS